MKTMKKIVAILAVAMLLCSILPLSVFAAEAVTINTYANTGTLDGTTSISWESGDYQVVSYKNTSTTAIRTSDADHFRYYVGNQLVISGKDGALMSKVVITCTGSSYMLNNASNTLGAGWTVSASGTTLTYTPDGGSASELTITIGKQSRSSNIVITPAASTEPEEPSTCEHVWVDANCTTPKTCSLCGVTEGEALGHSYGVATETVAPDCTNAGEKQSTCSVCGDVKTETVNALGHNYVDGICSVCGEAQPLEVTIETFANTGVLDGTASISWTNGGFQFTTYKASSTSAIRTSDADHFRVYAHNKVVVSGLNGELMTKVQFNATSASYATVLGGCAAEGWVASVDGTVVTFTATAAHGAESLTIEDVSAQTRVSSVIITPYVAAESDCEHDYVGVETQAPSCTVEGVTTYTCSKCGDEYTEAIDVIPHNYGEGVETQAPDCTNAGVKTYTCTVCGDVKTEDIPANGHNYVDDVCDVCGAVKAYKGTLVFDADKENRTEFSTQIQVWESNGLTFTNNKLSGNNIADYGAPVRIYKNSGIVIEFPEMSTLIIDASGVGNDYLWDATLEAAGLSFTVENKIYTITFAEAVNSIELTAANQVRANSITAIVAHEHSYAHAFDAECDKCGEIRAVVAPIVQNGFSVSEDVSGLAVRFTATLEGMGIDGTTAIYDNAMLNGYKVISMGAIATNGVSTIDVPAVYLCDDDVSTGAQYAIRIKNIPADKYDVEITFTPYMIVEIDGEQVTIEGEAVTGTYNQYAG